MQDFYSYKCSLFLLRLPQASLAEIPPERLPRRAVRGLGAHSPHQAGSIPGSLACACGKHNHSSLKFQQALADAERELHFCPQFFSQYNDEFPQFEGQAFVRIQCGGRISRKEMPYLDDKLACHCCDSDVAISFPRKEFPTPFAQSCICTHSHNCLGTLDEKMSDIATASFAHAQFDVFSVPAYPLAGIEANVGHELFGPIKAPHISDDRQQSKGIDLSDPQQLHAAQHQGFSANLLADESQQTRARLGLIGEVGEVSGEQLFLQHAPVALSQDPFPRAFKLKSAAGRTDGELVEVVLERVAGSCMVGDRILVGVEKFSTFAGHGIRNPHARAFSARYTRAMRAAAILSLSA